MSCHPRLISLLLIATACGGSGSGIDADKPVDQLTVAEATAICEATYGRVPAQDRLRASCYLAALAQQDQDCELVATQCIAAGTAVALHCDLSDSAASNGWPTCAAQVTAGEMEACAGALADRLDELADMLSCTAPADPGVLPEACAGIVERCPDLLGTVEDDEPLPG